jgi:Ala-tRNA(Pro) deacylase
MTIAATLRRYLDDQNVSYQVVTHPATGSSSETAQATHISGNRIAKAVVLSDNGGYVLAVVPASHHLRTEWVEQLVGRPLTMASEQDAARLFPDCEIGAIPPVGEAYGQDVVLDERLGGLDEVYFEGGDHRSLVKVAGDAFARLMGSARRGTISAHD